jgi:signal transduction histidine kinase
MNGSPSDLASLLGRCQAGITDAFRQPYPCPDRAARLANLLLELCPRARLTACRLGDDETGCLAIRPERTLDEEQGKRLRARLASLDPLAFGVQTLSSPQLPGVRLLATAAIHEADHPRGFLVIGLSGGEEEVIARAVVLLAACAPAVAVRGALELACGEQAELARFALVGQAFAGLAHELNNALNSMMLQASVVQLRVDEPTRHELAAIRQHGAQAAALVRSLQQVVMERRERSYPVDLRRVLAEVLEDNAELRRRITLQRSEQTPPISSTHSAVKQLVQLLLKGVLAGTKSAITVRTETQDEGTALMVTLAEASVDTTDGDSSPLDALLWQNLDEVSRQAAQSLLRQLGGTSEVEPRAEGGLTLRFRWGASSA